MVRHRLTGFVCACLALLRAAAGAERGDSLSASPRDLHPAGPRGRRRPGSGAGLPLTRSRSAGERAAGRVRGPLHGIPIVIKDNFETADMPTTAGSVALTGFMTGRDAFQVKRLREAGAIIIGKTNLHELASGITTISSAGGQTR